MLTHSHELGAISIESLTRSHLWGRFAVTEDTAGKLDLEFDLLRCRGLTVCPQRNRLCIRDDIHQRARARANLLFEAHREQNLPASLLSGR